MKIQKIQYLVALVAIAYAPNASARPFQSARPIQQAIVTVNQTAIVAPTINAGNGGSGGAGGVSAGGSAVGGASGSSGNGGSVTGTATVGGGDLLPGGGGGTATTTGTAGNSGDSGAGGSATGGSAGTANGGSGGSGSAGSSTLISPANIKFSNTVNVTQTYNEQPAQPIRGGGFSAPTPVFGGSNPAMVNTRGFGSRSIRFGR
jgi:hypothetical protein